MKNKTVILVLLMIIIADVALLLFYKNKAVPVNPAVKPDSTGVWTIFRGNSELDAHVKTIPEKPVVAWTFRAKALVDAGVVGEGNRIYFGDAEGNFYCLNINSGKVVWQKKISDGFSASALLVSGICYVGSQSGDFFAVSMADGNILWRHKIGEQISGSANYFRYQGEFRIIFGAYDFKLHCLDAKSGIEVWNVPTDNYINGAPAVAKDKIIFGGCDGYLRTVDALSGKEQSKLKLKSYIPASPAVYDSITYAAVYGQKVFALDRENKILWTYTSSAESAFLSSPAVNSEFVVIGDRDGLVHIIKRVNGKKIAEFQTGGDIAVGQIISDKKGLVADKDGFIYIFELKSGKEIWSYQVGPAITAPVALIGNKIIVADNDGNITAFSAK